MNIEVQKSKILRTPLLQANLYYISSVSIDDDLVEASNINDFEKVQVLNINQCERLESNVNRGEHKTGVISLNGASALNALINNMDSIFSFANMESEEAKSINVTSYFLLHQTN